MTLILRYCMRDLSAGLAGFRIFISCIVLGIAAITGVNSVTKSLSKSLAQESRQILGGDAAFSVVHRELDAAEREWLLQRGKISAIATLRAMTRATNGKSQLVELKAVAAGYPELGAVLTVPPITDLASLLEERLTLHGLVAEESLLARLDLKTGDAVTIGAARFEIRAVLKSEPDKLAGGFALGPRALISQNALRQTGLLQPGSLSRWTYRLILNDADALNNITPASDAAVQNLVTTANAAFPQAGWRVSTRNSTSSRMSRNVERFSQFLILVGLTALIIGGVGVSNAVRGFVEKKRRDFAILKSVGATGSYVVKIALAEILIVATIGIVFGLLAGAALPFVLAWLLAGLLPLPFSASVFPRELMFGAVYGILIALIFSILPLGRMHDLSVTMLFRGAVENIKTNVRKRYMVAVAVCVALFVTTVLFAANNARIAAIYLAATIAIFVLLRLIGLAIVNIARRAPRFGGPQMRLAISNIHRPGALTQSVVLSVGMGLSLLAALVTIDFNIREPLRRGIPGETPSFFFLDIQKQQAAEFETQVKKLAPAGEFESVPMMRGRLLQINGKDPASVRAGENSRWVLEGDRGITYAAALPAGSSLSEGKWWSADYAGPPLVSMESNSAEGLGLKVGDTVTINIAGRNVTATIANLRDVNWRSFGINFVFVFNTSALSGAPHSFLATVTFPAGPAGASKVASQQEDILVRELGQTFPAISMIRIKDTLDAITALARQLALAIQGATGVGLLASILVLAGAVSAGQSARRYDAVILKVLGASRNRLLQAYLIEFSLISLATAVFAVGAGVAVAWAILEMVLEIESFSVPWTALGAALGAALAITIILGLIGTWRILGQRVAPMIRTL